jgi:hypothetical protein
LGTLTPEQVLAANELILLLHPLMKTPIYELFPYILCCLKPKKEEVDEAEQQENSKKLLRQKSMAHFKKQQTIDKLVNEL